MTWLIYFEIAVDQYNNILIADSANSRVHLLDNKGQLIDYVLTWEDGISEPQALCINQQGHLVLTEATTGRMLLYCYTIAIFNTGTQISIYIKG